MEAYIFEKWMTPIWRISFNYMITTSNQQKTDYKAMLAYSQIYKDNDNMAMLAYAQRN